MTEDEKAEQDLDRLMYTGANRRSDLSDDSDTRTALIALATLSRQNRNLWAQMSGKLDTIQVAVTDLSAAAKAGPSPSESVELIREHRQVWDWYNQVQGALGLTKFLAGAGFTVAILNTILTLYLYAHK